MALKPGSRWPLMVALAIASAVLVWAGYGKPRWVLSEEAPGGVTWKRVPLWHGAESLPASLELPLEIPQAEGATLSARLLTGFDSTLSPANTDDPWSMEGMLEELGAQVAPAEKELRLQAARTWLQENNPAFVPKDLQYRLTEAASWRSTALQEKAVKPLGRVVVVGLDGLEPRVLLDGIKAGKLPHFGMLFQTGTGGTARPSKPIISPILWTTMATGTDPDTHGILDFYVQEDSGKRPVAGYHRKVPAVWNQAAMADRSVLLHGWWASDPVDADVQWGLSDKAVGPLYYQPGRFPSGAVRGYQNSQLAAYQRQAEAFLEQQGLPVWRAEQAADFADREQAIAATYTSSEVAWQALDDRLEQALPGSLLVHYVEGTDIMSHLCMAFRTPALPTTSEEDRQKYGTEVDRFYQYMDTRLGSLVRALGPEDILFLVTDHGFKSGTDKPLQGGDSMFGAQAEQWHTDQAQWLIWTRDGRHKSRVKLPENPFVGDFNDTVLAMLGLPHGERSWWQQPVEAKADWASLWQPTLHPGNTDQAANDQALENLAQLGYISTDALQDNRPPAASGETDTALVNRGIMALEKGDTDEARRLFEEALQSNPGSYSAHHNLTGLALRAENWSQAKTHFLKAQASNPQGTPQDWSDFMLLLAQQKQLPLVVEVGQAGVVRFPEDFALRQLLGTGLAQSGRCDLALPEFEKALGLRPDAYATLNNAALCAAQGGDKEQARTWLNKSLELNPDQPEVREFFNSL